MRAEATKDLWCLVFMVLTPALLTVIVVTASVAVSTGLAMVTVSLVMALAQRL